jgi:hypothetical protein
MSLGLQACICDGPTSAPARCSIVDQTLCVISYLQGSKNEEKASKVEAVPMSSATGAELHIIHRELFALPRHISQDPIISLLSSFGELVESWKPDIFNVAANRTFHRS